MLLLRTRRLFQAICVSKKLIHFLIEETRDIKLKILNKGK